MSEEKFFIPIENLVLDSTEGLNLGKIQISPAKPQVYKAKPRIHRFGYYLTGSAEEEEQRKFLEKILIVMKLFKDKVPHASIILRDGKPPLSLNYYIAWNNNDTYYISKDEESSFADFWRKYQAINQSNFAVRRFYKADFRPLKSDYLLDYVQALEYLFVPLSTGGKKIDKFRSRGSIVLGRNHEDKIKIFCELNQAYKLRNSIVHGDDTERDNLLKNRDINDPEVWEAEAVQIRHYCRRAIIYFFDNECLDDAEKRLALLEKEVPESEIR